VVGALGYSRFDHGRFDYNGSIESESLLFVDAIEHVSADTAVPTCPEWNADDLLWHLGRVQNFWATIISQGLTDEEEVERIDPARPDRRDGLLGFFHQARLSLGAALAAITDDATPVWTWSADRTVGFVRRRQAHEALIHRVDAEVTAGRRTPLTAGLCGDGVDEVLRVMYGGAPAWGVFTPDGRTARLDATDVGRSWLVALGRFTGEDPDEGPVDEADIRVLDDVSAEAAARFEGTAADLDCWLWHRPGVGAIQRLGDADTIEAFTSIVSSPVN
jgi:uncharacterized protein (TIGR03083 family)